MSLKRDEWPAKAIGFIADEVIEMAQKIREICDTAMVPSPDPEAPGYIAYADLTEADVLSWCWEDGIDKDATEASLQANIDLQISPVTASGTPWATA
jgi:hypothetical protein